MDLRKAVINKIQEVGVKDAAKYFGVSIGTASNWATGKSNPSIDAAQLMLDLLPPPVPKIEQELFEWEGKDVYILLPVYRDIMPWTHYTLFANYAKYGVDKVGLFQEIGTQCHETRNTLVHKFLKKTTARYCIFCDTDMVLPCGNAGLFHGNLRAPIPEPSASLVALSRIMSHPADAKIVGSLYFGRHMFGQAQCNSGFAEGFELEGNRLRSHNVYTALKPEYWVAPGFMRIDREVFELMDKAIADGMFPECVPNGANRPTGYFNPAKAGMGEDVSFGIRCNKIGIQSYLDPVLECLHSDGPFSHYGSWNTKNRPPL